MNNIALTEHCPTTIAEQLGNARGVRRQPRSETQGGAVRAGIVGVKVKSAEHAVEQRLDACGGVE